VEPNKSKWVRADFNGLFGRVLLCLSHDDFCTDLEGNRVDVQAGMILTAFDENYEDGKRDDLSYLAWSNLARNGFHVEVHAGR
jgi:hypothetical protein